MPMHEPDPNEEFAPSGNTKSMWRFTRKKDWHPAGTFPGLFQTHHYDVDATGFFLVIFLELWGLSNLLSVGGIRFVHVAGLFAADLLFAICRHLPQGEICVDENLLAVTTDPQEKGKIRSRLFRRRAFTHLFSLLIFLCAALKVVGFFALQGGEWDGLTLLILVSYAVAAVLHIKCTGFFLAGAITSVRMWLDHRAWIEGGQTAISSQRHQFPSSASILPLEVEKHRLVSIVDHPGVYALETQGILTDRQLKQFVFGQHDPDARVAVAIAGVKHQLVLLQMA